MAADLIVTLSTAQLANTGSATADVVCHCDRRLAKRNRRRARLRSARTATPSCPSAGTKTGTDGDDHRNRSSTGSDRGNRVITVTATSGVDLADGDAPGRRDHDHQRPRAGCHRPVDRRPGSVSRRRSGRQPDDRSAGPDRRALGLTPAEADRNDRHERRLRLRLHLAVRHRALHDHRRTSAARPTPRRCRSRPPAPSLCVPAGTHRRRHRSRPTRASSL